MSPIEMLKPRKNDAENLTPVADVLRAVAEALQRTCEGHKAAVAHKTALDQVTRGETEATRVELLEAHLAMPAAERAVRLHIEKAMGLLVRQWQLTETLLVG